MKTAVEWLLDSLDYNQQMLGIKEIIEQAKEMEREQIIKTYWASYKEALHSGDKTADEYYNETYKSEQ